MQVAAHRTRREDGRHQQLGSAAPTCWGSSPPGPTRGRGRLGRAETIPATGVDIILKRTSSSANFLIATGAVLSPAADSLVPCLWHGVVWHGVA